MNSQQPIFGSIASGQSESAQRDTASPGGSNPDAAASAVADQDTVTLDLTMARENFGFDEALLCEIANVFIEDVPQLIAELQQACQDADTNAMCRMAHSLKGLCATFGAEPARTYAQGIEHDCCDGRVASVTGQRIDVLVQSLRHTIATLRSELRLKA